MTKKISKKLLEEAKEKYMTYKSINSISKELDIPRSSLSHYVNKEWRLERDLARTEVVSQLAASKRQDFTTMTQSIITIMSRSLQHLAKRDTPPTTKEAMDAANILDKLDKITRLDNGDPTEILRDEKPATIIEIKEKLALDPFSEEIEDATLIEMDPKTN